VLLSFADKHWQRRQSFGLCWPLIDWILGGIPGYFCYLWGSKPIFLQNYVSTNEKASHRRYLSLVYATSSLSQADLLFSDSKNAGCCCWSM